MSYATNFVAISCALRVPRVAPWRPRQPHGNMAGISLTAEEAEEERCWVCLEGEEGGPLVQL